MIRTQVDYVWVLLRKPCSVLPVTDSETPIDTARKPQWPFILTFILASLALGLLAGWAATDASFRIATWKARVALYLESIPTADPEMEEALGITNVMRSIRWDAVGKRAVAFYVLFLVGICATTVNCIMTIRRFDTRRMKCCVLLLTGWAVLYATRDQLQDWRAHRQVAALMPTIEQAASALHKRWPTEPGNIPPNISFYVSPEQYPDVLTIRGRRPSYPFHEDLGLMITRGKNGIIRFDLAAAYDSAIEFHPNGTVPAAYTSGFGYPSPPVATATQLKQNWYLVRYGG